jgi:hypothetical protein
MPMGLNSTRFVTFHEIKTDKIDLIEDAFGFYPEFMDVIEVLKKLKPLPGKATTSRLIARIRREV